ncbi:MAG: hypothetical protein ACE5MK_11980 [Acidobacteriota bacterium]
MKLKAAWVFLWIVITTLAACASFDVSAVPTPQLEAMPAWKSEGAVQIGADPFIEPTRQQRVFGANFNAVGILAVQVLVKNRGKNPVQVTRSEIALKLAEGHQIRPASKTEVVKYFTPKGDPQLPPVGYLFLDPRVHAGANLGAGLGTMALRVAKAIPEAKRLADYRKKELKDVVLQENGVASGFVYFILQRGTPSFSEATLVVPVVNVEKAERYIANLELKELGFKWIPHQAQEAQSSD